MNRHSRRAQAKVGGVLTRSGSASSPGLALDIEQQFASLMALMAPLQEASNQFETLKPHMEVLLELPDKLEEALEEVQEALDEVQNENNQLRGEIERQRHVFLGLIAQVMGIPLKQVLSMEAALLKQLPTNDDANETPDPDEEDDD